MFVFDGREFELVLIFVHFFSDSFVDVCLFGKILFDKGCDIPA